MEMQIKAAIRVLARNAGKGKEFDAAVRELVEESRALAESRSVDAEKLANSTLHVLEHVGNEIVWATLQARVDRRQTVGA